MISLLFFHLVGTIHAAVGNLRGATEQPTAITGPLHVVTDMWFDDLGAIAILHANGITPASITAANGMMDAKSWTSNFSKILATWNVTSPLYESNIDCSVPDTCQRPSWASSSCGLGLGDCDSMSTNGFDNIVGADASSSSMSFLAPNWKSMCPPGAGCTILSLAPAAEVARALQDAASGISKIVMMGGLFKETPQGRRLASDDAQTSIQVAYPALGEAWPEYNQSVVTEGIETNIFSDPEAFQSLLAAISKSDTELVILPLEVASFSRVGKEMLQDSEADHPLSPNGTLNMDVFTQQSSFSTQKAESLCTQRGTPLQQVACMYEPFEGSVITLDADAIAASYLVYPELYTLMQTQVAVDTLSLRGLTSICSAPAGVNCVRAQVATEFNATQWYGVLNGVSV